MRSALRRRPMTSPPLSPTLGSWVIRRHGQKPGRSARTAPADASAAAVRPRTVVVPRRPGSLREYQPRSRRRRDELDDLIDELFGPTTDEKPGRFDAGLAVVGLSLAAWAIILGGPRVALWIGISAIVLGLALPARAVLRRFDLSRSGGLRRRTIDRRPSAGRLAAGHRGTHRRLRATHADVLHAGNGKPEAGRLSRARGSRGGCPPSRWPATRFTRKGPVRVEANGGNGGAHPPDAALP